MDAIRKNRNFFKNEDFNIAAKIRVIKPDDKIATQGSHRGVCSRASNLI